MAGSSASSGDCTVSPILGAQPSSDGRIALGSDDPVTVLCPAGTHSTHSAFNAYLGQALLHADLAEGHLLSLCGIDPDTVGQLLSAPSKGRFYNTSIKGRFDCLRERPCRGGSCRRLGLSRSYRRLMSRLRVTFSTGIDSAEVMLRMLGVIFRGDAISGRLGVAGHRQIFASSWWALPRSRTSVPLLPKT